METRTQILNDLLVGLEAQVCFHILQHYFNNSIFLISLNISFRTV